MWQSHDDPQRRLPAENFGTVVAAIESFSPVFGFLPSRAARADALKVPKPISETDSPLATALTIAPVTASSALAASTLVSPASSAIASISSDLFMLIPWFGGRGFRMTGKPE
jgi:hypothetical protein